MFISRWYFSLSLQLSGVQHQLCYSMLGFIGQLVDSVSMYWYGVEIWLILEDAGFRRIYFNTQGTSLKPIAKQLANQLSG